MNFNENLKYKSIFLTGVVMSTVDPRNEGCIGVSINKLMKDSFSGAKPTPIIVLEPLRDTIIANDKKLKVSKFIHLYNMYWVRPLLEFNSNIQIVHHEELGREGRKIEEFQETPDLVKNYDIITQGEYKVPRVGTKVFVFFLDGDPQKGYYLPWSATQRGEKINGLHSFNKENWTDSRKKRNIHLKEYWNGLTFEIDTNQDENTFHITFDDGNKKRGHRFKMTYNSGKKEMELFTQDKNRILLDDLNKIIMVASKEGNHIIIDDANQNITTFTKNNNAIMIDDADGKISILQKDKNTIYLDGSKIKLLTKLKQIILLENNNIKVQASDNCYINLNNNKINIQSQSDVNIVSNSKITLSAPMVDIKATTFLSPDIPICKVPVPPTAVTAISTSSETNELSNLDNVFVAFKAIRDYKKNYDKTQESK